MSTVGDIKEKNPAIKAAMEKTPYKYRNPDQKPSLIAKIASIAFQALIALSTALLILYTTFQLPFTFGKAFLIGIPAGIIGKPLMDLGKKVLDLDGFMSTTYAERFSIMKTKYQMISGAKDIGVILTIATITNLFTKSIGLGVFTKGIETGIATGYFLTHFVIETAKKIYRHFKPKPLQV